MHAFLLWFLVPLFGVVAFLARPSSGDSALPSGHLILQVEGDARALQVTRITRKPDPHNPVVGVSSAYAVVVQDAAGVELGRYPLDLSRFDLDPARIGQAPRVAGCEVWDARVAMLTNVPDFAGAARLELRRGDVLLGAVEGAAFARLLAEGQGR